MIEENVPEVLMVPPDVNLQELHDYIEGMGPIPQGAYTEPFEVYAARGRVSDCDCQLIQCVCTEARQHVKGCRYRLALTCAVPIHCEDHGFDVCPTCDVCDCAQGTP